MNYMMTFESFQRNNTLEHKIDDIVNEFKLYVIEDERINEVLDPITLTFAIAGGVVAFPKLVDGIGILARKVHNLFKKEEGDKWKTTEFEKFGNKLHHKIIHGISWALKKLFKKLSDDKAELIANILYWGIVISLGFVSGIGAVKGLLSGAHGLAFPLIEAFLAAIKGYELWIVILGVIGFVSLGANVFNNKLQHAVEAAESCVEDHVSKKDKDKKNIIKKIGAFMKDSPSKAAKIFKPEKVIICMDQKARKMFLKHEVKKKEESEKQTPATSAPDSYYNS